MKVRLESRLWLLVRGGQANDTLDVYFELGEVPGLGLR
jgi:hypothetical protein